MSKKSNVRSQFSKNLEWLRRTRIKACREAKDRKGVSQWTQEAVGKKIKVSRAVYHTYESGKNEPSIETMVRISNLWGIPIDNLVKVNLKTASK